VSVLFADLVGFTTLSEKRDAEEVRELLSRYFETCRTLIGRYGGTVEKFIGDAVMAVWGAPVAREDDAERAVRAALDITAAVANMGEEIRVPDLRARAGVLTGEAAITVGAQGEGMVAGDLVNSASRIQSAAPAGSVFVGGSTKQATEAAIAYEDAGAFEMKGKSDPMQLWRAVRVVAGRGGVMRSTALEPPFVGRDRELRLVKEIFHASAEEKKAHLVSVIGIGGIGKSRLSWEFEKYIDGLVDDIYWHRGRCLAYGEGVAYWALAEMVRMRCEILEDEEGSSAAAKLGATVAEIVRDPEERTWVEPRLAQLLGLIENPTGEREKLFSAWRLFFERMAAHQPLIMVFEDLQWADDALMDFVEYLLDWSRDLPIFVLTLARPELADRRANWGAGKRYFTSLYLDPLSPDAMEELLAGLVPGLPDQLREQILQRAEGVPLYAVETVRMLMDRGVLAGSGNTLELAGDVDALEIPETLHALIAARLDGLALEEKSLVQDASVLGKVFTRPGVLALTGMSEETVDRILASLVRKEVLSLQADPRSPERGQYGFLQDLVKRVAYETLSKHDRKKKHLAAAEYIEGTWSAEEDEIVEVVAAHYLDAYRLVPDAEDAAQIRRRAAEMLVRAAERAESVAAYVEGSKTFEQAAELVDEPLEKAMLLERAGVAARTGGASLRAEPLLEAALKRFEAEGATHPAARVSARLGEIEWDTGRLGEAAERLETAFEALSNEPPDEDLATFATQLSRILFFSGNPEKSLERVEIALEMSEGLGLQDQLAQALTTKAVIYYSAKGRRVESLALLRHALSMAEENGVDSTRLRIMYNLADLLAQEDRPDEGMRMVRRGIEVARRLGNRFWEWSFLGQLYPFFVGGRWEELETLVAQLPADKADEYRSAYTAFLMLVPLVRLHTGDLERAEEAVTMVPDAEASSDIQEKTSWLAGQAAVCLVKGNAQVAFDTASAAFENRSTLGVHAESIKESFVTAVEAAMRLGRTDDATRLLGVLESLPPARIPRYLKAYAMMYRARMTEDRVVGASLFGSAADIFRSIPSPFPLAVTLLERAEIGTPDERLALLDEALAIFQSLAAGPWVERVEAARS
jgi:predicted ATPase/class 3 adenylate cyclase